MQESLAVLTLTAASIGLIHTLIGPDHYLPFIMMARAGQWSRIKASWVTFLCGVGHVASSIVLGAVGIALGLAVGRLEAMEAARGELAAWVLIAFGLLYGLWGIRRGLRGQTHSHSHLHENSAAHDHDHHHETEHAHAHEDSAKKLTPWVLFTVFVLGPCEPLIPLLMVPASRHSWWGVGLVASVFGLVTVGAMLAVVALGLRGVSMIQPRWLERYVHAVAGFVIAGSGLAIRFLGL